MPEIIYCTCTLTSFLCAFLLARAYRRTPSHLLLWSMICFLGFALSNILLVCDMMIFPNIDFVPFRTAMTFLSSTSLLYGLVWEPN